MGKISVKQTVVGLIVLALALGTSSIYLAIGNWRLAVFIVFGIAYGFILQRSRFCFASSFRDLFITRDARLARGVILGLLVATVGFSLLLGLEIQKPHVQPAGVHTVVGGFLFGLGMVLAGGCASGTLYRCGEGYLSLWVALGGTILGMMILAVSWPFLWFNYIQYQPKLWFPAALGWPLSVTATISLLVSCFLIVTWWERGSLKTIRSTVAHNPSGIQRVSGGIFRNPFANAWPAWLGGILLGFLNVLEFYLVGTPWGITTPESRWAGWLLKVVGFETDSWLYYIQYKLPLPWLDGGSLLDIGIIVGAFIASSLAFEFKIRSPPRRRLPQAFIGGILMGYGARLAMGCNIGAFFSAIPQLALFGWLFTIGLIFGAFVGAKLVTKL